MKEKLRDIKDKPKTFKIHRRVQGGKNWTRGNS